MVRPRTPCWYLLALFLCATIEVALATPEARISELQHDSAINENGRAPAAAEAASVIVTSIKATIAAGVTTTLAAAALVDNNSTIPGVPFAWASSLPSVAMVSSTGVEK